MGRSYAALVAALLASGCAETTSIYHAREVPANNARIVTTDAKQRSVLMIPALPGDKGSTWRMCAEAAPDAFSALSASASLAADAKSQSGKAAAAIAETAGTIERTQTINLLRESMYRTCERWLSGALTDDQFIIQAARDQKSMVTILAIEQLTRTARPAATILTPAGTSASVATGEQQAELVAGFVKERDEAKAARDDAERAFKKVEKDCTNLATPPADADQAATEKWTTCNTARGVLADRDRDQAAAKARLDKVLSALGDGGAASGAKATTVTGVPLPGGGDGAGDLGHVARAVAKIVGLNSIDEALMFCVAYLQRSGAQDKIVAPDCMTIIKNSAKNSEQLKSELFDYKQAAEAPRAIISQYLSPDLSIKDRKQRWKNIEAAAKAINLANADIVTTIYGGDSTALLQALRTIETDPAAIAVLTNP